MKDNWIDDKVNVITLHLDLQNPRLPKHIRDSKNVDKVRTYLLEKEGVIKIARSIAKNGYHRSAIAIVCEEKGKFIVLDGNRRLVACQFLLNPELAKNSRSGKELESLSKILNKKELESVKITIAPSRKDAEKEIWDIHVNQLLKSWQVLQKLRMYRNLIDSGEYSTISASNEYGLSVYTFKKELAKLFFYEKILEKVNEKEEEELLNSGFNKIDRLILSENGKKLLNYDVDDNGSVIIKNKSNFEKNLKKIIPYITDRNKVNPQIRQEELEKEVFAHIDPVKFAAKNKNVKTNSKEALKKNSPGTFAKSDWVTFGEYKSYKGAERVKKILEEMYKFKNPNDNKNILTISLRILFELSLYYKLEKTGHIAKIITNHKKLIKQENDRRFKKGHPIVEDKKDWAPGFREMINYIVVENNNAIADPAARTALQSATRGEDSFIDDLNRFIHNVYHMPQNGDPERLWSKIGRLLLEVIQKIS